MGDIKGPAPEQSRTFTREEVCKAFGVPWPEGAVSMARAAALRDQLGLDAKQVAAIEDMLSDGRLMVQRDPWDAGGAMRFYAPTGDSPISRGLREAVYGPDQKQDDPSPYTGIGAPIAQQLGQIVVEVDLGPDDVLLLTCEQALRYGLAERYAAELRAVLEKPGRQAIVIDAGMVPMVLHRTIHAEDKARKAKPYLEDAAKPAAPGQKDE